MGTGLRVSMLRFKDQCRSTGRWSVVRRFNLLESTPAKRSLQTLSPSLKDCRSPRNMFLVRGTKKALTCAYEAWSRLVASELIPFLGIDCQKQVDVARRCSCRDVKTRWVVPVASVNAPVCDVEVWKRAWCIARDRLTDLLCVVQKWVVPSYASQVGRALMTGSAQMA